MADPSEYEDDGVVWSGRKYDYADEAEHFTTREERNDG